MLYKILKRIIKIALRVFFSSKKILGKENIPPLGVPLLVVCNHPNTFMDPLLVAHSLKQEMFFLANASLFSSPFNRWLLTRLNMIPIQRKEDKNKKKYSNAEIFKKCFDHLNKKGAILIFPEGTSIHGRRLQPIKTGAARIALGAEAAKDFQLGVQILPIGLNYSKPESFRSEVFIQIDKPIDLKDFAEIYQQNEEQAVDELTEQIRSTLSRLTIVTDDHEEEILARNIETIYKTQLNEDIVLSENPKEQDFLMRKGIVDAINHFETHEYERVKSLRPKIQSYLQNLQRLRLNDEWFSKKKQSRNIFRDSLRDVLFLVFGFPFFLYGIINNYIPYIIPSKVAANISKYIEYTAPIMMATGIFTFGFFYPLQIFLVWFFTTSWLSTLLYALSLPPSAFFALYYAHYLYSAQDQWRLFSIFYKRSDLVSNLLEMRKEILKALEKAKDDYLAFYIKK